MPIFEAFGPSTSPYGSQQGGICYTEMVGASSSAKEPNRPPAWDQAEELVALDRLRFQHLHRVIYAHRQRVENAESYYDVLETERQAEVMHARAEAMRISRAK